VKLRKGLSAMSEERQAFIFLSPEVKKILDENGIDLVEELNRSGHDVKRTFAPDPAAADRDRSKAAELVILTSAMAFGAVTFGITKIIDALGRNKKILVKEHRCVPVVDNSGAPVLTKEGQPILHWVEVARLVETANAMQPAESMKIKAGGERGFSFEIVSGKQD
jgi:pyruvate/2-oxoglutarate dehydrogenase complex dihydrolipoamide acyltransferase (E2) component